MRFLIPSLSDSIGMLRNVTHGRVTPASPTMTKAVFFLPTAAAGRGRKEARGARVTDRQTCSGGGGTRTGIASKESVDGSEREGKRERPV